MSNWGQFGFQEGVSPIMEEFILFHDLLMMLLILIMGLVSVVLWGISVNSWISGMLMEGQLIESIWTFLPGIILVFIAVPSISFLYLYDEEFYYLFSMKVLGNQWYWSYELGGSSLLGVNLSWDSYMLTQDFLQDYDFRLLDVDSSLVIPYSCSVQLLVSSKDVLHSWTVPSLGVKVDAVPGRLNSLSLFSFRPGVYFGQCSEICGAQHSFMPVVMECISLSDFILMLGVSG